VVGNREVTSARLTTVIVFTALLLSPSIVPAAPRCTDCPRDPHGRIERSREAVREFKRTTPRPPDCVRCEIDHVVPLSKGGKDAPENMQWLPRREHQDKTRRDLRGPGKP
jgi:5-methylcytosine-specific restriction endonuclease McrA